MKKIIIILLLLIPILTIGQTIPIPFKYKTTDWSDVTKLADKIITLPKHHYEITEIDSSRDNYSNGSYGLTIKIVMISDDNNVKNRISLEYLQEFVGYNKDLETAGTKTFFFKEILGWRYLDMFEIWKTFFDPKADVQKIATEQQTEVFLDDKVMKRASFFKVRIDGSWIITIWQN